MKRTIVIFILLFHFTTIFASPPGDLEQKFPKAKAVIPLIKQFPLLAKLLVFNDAWTQSPQSFVTKLFPGEMKRVQGSEAHPLMYDAKRSAKWQGIRCWNQFAYETEYYVFDPSRPVIRFHLGRPLDIRMQLTEQTQSEELKQTFPVLADSARKEIAGFIQKIVDGLKQYGAKELPFHHPRIHLYLLPGNIKLKFSDFTGTGIGSVYLQIDLEPAEPVVSLLNKQLPAFPGAEGYGAFTPGGRRGKVYIVTTLEDYLSRPREGRKEGSVGEAVEGQPPPVLPAYPEIPKEKIIHGSLREALEAHGPRIILFAVAGTIELKDQLIIRDPYVTIAGNTAPGQGIQIRNWGITIATHDVVMRYLRVRVGDIKGPGKMPRVLGDQTHAIDISGANIIVDHCEFAYANDQVVNLYGLKPEERLAVSFQWNYVYGGLINSTHEKGPHSMSYFLTGWGYASFHHNLTAHSARRNPRAWGLWLDYRNNILYDYIDAGYGESPDDYLKLNYVGNLQKSGVQRYAFIGLGTCGQYYVADNVMPAFSLYTIRASKETIMNIPFDAPSVKTEKATDAFDEVLRWGGAVLPYRDSITNFISETTRNGTGDIPKTTDDWPLGGFAVYEKTAPLPDSDHDGMPDKWEGLYKLNPFDASDADKDGDHDGYTNIEEYINGTSPAQYVNYYNPDNNFDIRLLKK